MYVFTKLRIVLGHLPYSGRVFSLKEARYIKDIHVTSKNRIVTERIINHEIAENYIKPSIKVSLKFKLYNSMGNTILLKRLK